MREARSFTSPVALGDVMTGGAVGVVDASENPDFEVGDIVEGRSGWQDYAVLPADELRRIDPDTAPISTAIGVLGMPGMTAYFGLLEVGKPGPGETVLVSAASGAVGGLVGQIAKINGCRAVGIAGSDAKCGYIVDELGYDAAINRKTENVAAALEKHCPDGIDVYFDNVGGTILDAALDHINMRARIVICGMISEYNLVEPELARRPTRILLTRRARMQGMLVFDYRDRYPEGLRQMARWIDEGRVKYKEDIVDGLENAPSAFIGLLRGENFGKRLIRVSEDPTVT